MKPKELSDQHGPVTFQMPNPEQFKAARALFPTLSEDRIPEETYALSLPVDSAALRAIERGEAPGSPTKTTGSRGIDYAGTQFGRRFYADLDYPTRLWLFYILKGVVFFRNEQPRLMNPYDLFGPLLRLPNAHADHADNPGLLMALREAEQPDEPIDVLRMLMRKAMPGLPR